MKITPAWSFSNLTFSQIEAGDTLFDWFPGVLSVSLQNSLEQNGIQLPLLVQAIQHSKYRLVDGFKRFSWLTTDTGVSLRKNKKLYFRALFFRNRCRSRKLRLFVWKPCPHLQRTFPECTLAE